MDKPTTVQLRTLPNSGEKPPGPEMAYSTRADGTISASSAVVSIPESDNNYASDIYSRSNIQNHTIDGRPLLDSRLVSDDIRQCKSPAAIDSKSEVAVVSNSRQAATRATTRSSNHSILNAVPRGSCSPLERILIVTLLTLLLIVIVSSFLVYAVIFRPLLMSARLNFLDDGSNPDEAGVYTNICLTEDCVHTASMVLSAMDSKASPCHDFLEFACGQWNQEHKIPEDRTDISRFDELVERTKERIRDILSESVSDNEPEYIGKVKTYFHACMDTATIERLGVWPINFHLSKMLGPWPALHGRNNSNLQPDGSLNATSLAIILAHAARRYAVHPLFYFNVGPDDRDSTVNRIRLHQSSLTVSGTEDYIQKNWTQLRLLRAAYREYIENTMWLTNKTANESLIEPIARNIVDLEFDLAMIMVPREDQSDPRHSYERVTIPELQASYRWLDWRRFFDMVFDPIHINDTDPIIIFGQTYFVQFEQIHRKYKHLLLDYIFWRMLSQLSKFGGFEFGYERFKFLQKFSNISVDTPRWSKCYSNLMEEGVALADAVSAVFIRRYVDSETLQAAKEMIDLVKDTFAELLLSNDWMDEVVRQKALSKVHLMGEKIGFHPNLLNQSYMNNFFTNLSLDRYQLLSNHIQLVQFTFNATIARVNRQSDRELWEETPATVNAYYDPNMNSMIVPAGILQPFFYSKTFPRSLNFGALGVVIGHEITHGFDSRGRLYNANGTLEQWWDDETDSHFQQKAACMAEQYSSLSIREYNGTADGNMTLAENIADNGGLRASFNAYQKWLRRVGQPIGNVPIGERRLPAVNLTHDQLFFVSYAQIWCGSMRPNTIQQKIMQAEHSLPEHRIRGPLSNFEAFSDAFSCPVGSPMNPAVKCKVW